MTRLIFIRHAESDYEIKDDFSRPLTISGNISAKAIPGIFKEIKIDHFYCSPFIRSISTIQHLADQRHIDINLSSNLQERRVGSWVEDFFVYAAKQWQDFNYKIDNGESLREVQNRNIAEVKQILNNHQNQNIVIGTHGTALCTILNYYDKKINFSYFLSIAKKMPLFVELSFDNLTYLSMIELNADALANVL